MYSNGFASFSLGGFLGWRKMPIWKGEATAFTAMANGQAAVAIKWSSEGMFPPANFAVIIYDVTRKAFVQELSNGTELPGPYYNNELKALTMNVVLVAGLANNGNIAIWDKSTTSRIFYDGIKGDAACVALHPQQQKVLVAGTEDGNVVLLQITSEGKLEEIQRFKASEGQTNTVAWSPDGAKLAIGTQGKTVEYGFAVTTLKKGAGLAP